MSDAFADLWSSTGASKPTQPPQKLGALAAPAQVAPRKHSQNDVFSMLAAASSTSVTSRSATPSHIPARHPALPVQKAFSVGSTSNGSSVPTSGDAFSGLLSGFSSKQSTGANLTIAQRAALAEKEKRERASQSPTPIPQTPATWAGLDALASSSATSTSAPHPKPTRKDHLNNAGRGSLAPSSRSPPQPPPEDDWGFGEFTSQPASKSAAISPSIFDDLDDFVSAPTTHSISVSRPPRSSTPGDFDFGDREDGLLNNQSDDEDDILGDLAKPVEHLAARNSARNTPSPQPANPVGQPPRVVSPPPHILGQIVEMGFSIQQARVALAATDTGLDVQAALETLLSNGAGSSSSPPPQIQQERRKPHHEPGHERYYSSDEENAPPRRKQTIVGSASPDRPARDGTAPSSDTQRNLQDQADKLIAQASEIGLSMFSRANAFWKEGKERVQKVYEEHAAGASSSKPSTGDATKRNGRPKWMLDAPEGEHTSEAVPSAGRFKDDDDGVSQAKQSVSRAKEPQYESPVARMKVGNLFSDDAPTVYVSPYRRKTPGRTTAQTTPEGPSIAPPSTSQPTPKPSPPRAPSPIALVRRHAVSATQPAIAASAQHKKTGTEKFKLGQYGEAEASYSAAITALPEGHLLLVPLFNNRALTRYKNGDATGAIEDCTTVIGLIGPSYHPAREAKVARDDEGASVDLADALVKAWRRRAEAYESKEKWEPARADWEALVGVDFVGAKIRSEALTGIGRCRRMLNPEQKVAPAPSAGTLRSLARARVRTPPSEALNRVREANEAAEAEDQAKHDLKDTVDVRLGAWRAGKENNIRALIASLDTVLWPELGWQKVGIHELVSPSQVKIRYTKAIAKLHPDKLNVKNTTVEQRMIANGVFGSLNEAWNAFKP